MSHTHLTTLSQLLAVGGVTSSPERWLISDWCYWDWITDPAWLRSSRSRSLTLSARCRLCSVAHRISKSLYTPRITVVVNVSLSASASTCTNDHDVLTPVAAAAAAGIGSLISRRTLTVMLRWHGQQRLIQMCIMYSDLATKRTDYVIRLVQLLYRSTLMPHLSLQHSIIIYTSLFIMTERTEHAKLNLELSGPRISPFNTTTTSREQILNYFQYLDWYIIILSNDNFIVNLGNKTELPVTSPGFWSRRGTACVTVRAYEITQKSDKCLHKYNSLNWKVSD